MKTVTFDPAVYRLVPIEKTHEMTIAAYDVERTLAKVYDALLAAVPDDLPGVVTHSGEPCGYMVQYSCAAQDGSMIDGPFAFVDETDASEYERRIGIPLFTHPAPDAQSIIAATIEVAAVLCEKRGGTGVAFSNYIRTLDPQSILDGMKP